MARFDFMSLDLLPPRSPENFVPTLYRLNSESLHMDWIFQPKENVTITDLGFNLYSITGTPPIYRIALKSVDVDGEPDDILISKTFTPDASMVGHFNWISTQTSYKAKRGEFLCLSIQHYSGYISNTNCISVIACLTDRDISGLFPYNIGPTTYAGATFNRGDRSSDPGIYGFKSTSRSYGYPIKTVENTTANNPAEIGMRIYLNSEFGKSFKIAGALPECKLASTSGQTVDLILYDADNNALNAITWDCDVSLQPTISNCPISILFDDATLQTLTFGKEYFIALAPGAADNNLGLLCSEVESSFDLTAFPGGSHFYLVSRANSSAEWTRTRTKRPHIDLIIDDWST